jgi:NAD(P)-dependent dehydrogenase (short-subunit alcohol dehydrogenase family)
MKTALITGANRGIGFEISKQLAEKGFLVFLSARNNEKGNKAAEDLKKKGLNIEFLQLDVIDKESIASAVEKFGTKSKNLDVLINNAAILIDDGDITKLELETFQQTLTTNTIGPYLVIRAFLPFMESGSRIINISSDSGSLHNMGSKTPAYSISKTALNAVTRQFAAVLKKKGVAINSVHPGWVRTDMGGLLAPRSLKKGAETPLWLAVEAPIELTGKYLYDKKEMEW